MEDINTNLDNSGIHILSYIGIGSLMFSVACILFIAITCCYQILFDGVLQWFLDLTFFRRRKKDARDDSNPSSGLLASGQPVHLMSSVPESSVRRKYTEP